MKLMCLGIALLGSNTATLLVAARAPILGGVPPAILSQASARSSPSSKRLPQSKQKCSHLPMSYPMRTVFADFELSTP
jgi:hypothetical protein